MSKKKAETETVKRGTYLDIPPTVRLRNHFVELNRRGLSQDKIAESAGLTQGVISAWLRGDSTLSGPNIDKLCLAYRIGLFLMDGSLGENRPLSSLGDVYQPVDEESATEILAAREQVNELLAENDRLRAKIREADTFVKQVRDIVNRRKAHRAETL